MPFRVQRKRTSSATAKEKAAYHSPFHCWPAFGGLLCAARLREMALNKNFNNKKQLQVVVFSALCLLITANYSFALRPAP